MAISNTSVTALSSASLFVDTDSTGTKAAVKASSAVVYLVELDNTANAGGASFLKLWNTASGGVTVGTTAPDYILMAPASTKVTAAHPSGITFGTALTAATVTTAGTAGSTDPTSDVIVRIVYV